MKNEIYPCLWFDGQAYEAAEFYCSVFPDSEIFDTNPIVTSFQINGNRFIAINGGNMFTFNESVSFVVECENQERIDYYWDKLTDGGEESMCGWLKDKYGVSWQVVPAGLTDMMKDPDKSQRIFQVISPMRKLDFLAIKNA